MSNYLFFKISIRLFIVLLAISLLIFSWSVLQNNRDIESATPEYIQKHFDKSVSWLENNYSSVEDTTNPILWWMVKQAAIRSNNETLNKIYFKYKTEHLDNKPPNLSTPMFNQYFRPKLPDISAFSKLYDYQTFFFYALSCDENFAVEPLIRKQLIPDFCSLHLLRQSCITHQVMGLRFMQRNQCGYDEVVNETLAQLKEILISELTWDFRVGDVYIQRVLMMLDLSGYSELKPIWIKNILREQNTDGGWDDFDPIIYLGNDYFLAYSTQLFTIKKIKSDFHSTAQAIWLLSMLVEETKKHP